MSLPPPPRFATAPPSVATGATDGADTAPAPGTLPGPTRLDAPPVLPRRPGASSSPVSTGQAQAAEGAHLGAVKGATSGVLAGGGEGLVDVAALAALAEPGSGAASAQAPEAGLAPSAERSADEDTLHATACVRYISSLLGQLCNQPQMQTVWSLSLPLDPELLWSTVLHLRYCPTQLSLEFATTDWATRELLRPHLPSFQRQLQALVHPACEVWVSV